MHPHHSTCRTIAATAFILSCLPAVAGEKTYKQPATEQERWELRLSMPAWLAGADGETGLGGNVAESDVGFTDIVPLVDMTGALRFELRKGHFGVYGDFLYMSVSDGKGSDRLIKKLDFRQDQIAGDLGLSWRIIDSDRGYLEILGGVRYTNLYEEVNLQANDQRVREVSERLARAGTVARVVLASELRELSRREIPIPGPQPAAVTAEQVAGAVERIRGSEAERADRIERRLQRDLNRRIVRVDDWFDPYIGIRARYNFNHKYYALGRADIGGFGVGADISWQASGGIGCMLNENTFLEITYRALGVDYDRDGLVYDMITHGPEISLGKIF